MQSCSRASCLIAWRTPFASCPMCTHRLISTSQTWFAYTRQNFREDGRVLGCSTSVVGQTRPLMAPRLTNLSELQFDSFVQVSMNERRLRDASTIRSDAVEHALTSVTFGQMVHLSFNERVTARENIAVEDDEGLPDDAARHLTARAPSTASQRDELPHATTRGGFLADLCVVAVAFRVVVDSRGAQRRG